MLFKDEVKIIASAGTDQSNSGTKVKANTVPALVATDKQKNIELVQKKHQISMAEIKWVSYDGNDGLSMNMRFHVQTIYRNSFSGRGRGAMTAGRGRGRAKPKVEEPVILTLISDDEDDDQKV